MLELISEKVKNTVLKKQKSKQSYVQYLVDMLNCDEQAARRIGKSILKEHKSSVRIPSTQSSVELTVDETEDPKIQHENLGAGTYTYNPLTKDYTLFLKSTGGRATIKDWKHKGIIEAYCVKNSPIDEICRKYGFPSRAAFEEYKKIFKLTHNSDPVTDEDLAEKDDETIIQDKLARRRFDIEQEFQKREWQLVQDDAVRWRDFKNKIVDPLERVVTNVDLPKIDEIPTPPVNLRRKSNDLFVIGLNDIHFGLKADEAQLYYGSQYNTETVVKIVDEYAQKIAADINNRNYNIKKALVVVAGDILHTLTGRTKKGTPLEYDEIGISQWLTAEKSLIKFFVNLLNIFKTIEVHVVKGNHAGIDELTLFRSIENRFFNNRNRITFDISERLVHDFRLGNHYILLTHGASDAVEARVPNGVDKREAYFLKLMNNNPEKLLGAKSKIVFMGDQHHYERKEYNGFEFIMLPSTVKGCRYADHLNLHSRPSQRCFILSESEGLREELAYYFD